MDTEKFDIESYMTDNYNMTKESNIKSETFQEFCQRIKPFVDAGANNGDAIQVSMRGQSIWRDVNMCSFNDCLDYRFKPKSRMINGFEVPSPMSDTPNDGDAFWYIVLGNVDFCNWAKWKDVNNILIANDLHTNLLKRGLCFSNKKDAVANAKAMLGIDPNKED